MKNCCSWSVVLVSKGILEKYHFLVVLRDDKTCVGFNYLNLTFKKLQKLHVLNSDWKRKFKYFIVKLAELFSLKVVNLYISLSVTLFDSKA